MLDVDQNYGEPDTPKPLPTFKDYVAQDVETVFFNLNEFAEERYIDDKQMACGCTARSAAPSTAVALWPLLRQSTTTACTTTRLMPARPMSAYPFPPPAWKMAPKS